MRRKIEYTLEPCCDGWRVAVLRNGLAIHTSESVEAAKLYLLHIAGVEETQVLSLAQAVQRVR